MRKMSLNTFFYLTTWGAAASGWQLLGPHARQGQKGFLAPQQPPLWVSASRWALPWAGCPQALAPGLQGQPSPGGRSTGGSRRTRCQHRRQRAGGVGGQPPRTSSLASCVIALNPQRQEHRTDFGLPIPTSKSLPPWPGVGVCERAPPPPCANTDRCTT